MKIMDLEHSTVSAKGIGEAAATILVPLAAVALVVLGLVMVWRAL